MSGPGERPFLCYGEVLWDRFPDGRELLGGAPFNLAWRLGELGRRAVMVSRVGIDPPGDEVLARMARAALETVGLQRDPERPTGRVEVRFGPGGEPDYFIVPGMAYDRIGFTPELAALAGTARALCFGSLAQREQISRLTLRRLLEAVPADCLRVLDLNLRKDCWSPELVAGALAAAGVVKLNESEAGVLAGLLFGRELPPMECCRELLRRFPVLRACLVTLGERGVLGLRPGEPPVYLPGYAVTVADTVGAGDAFTAGLVHRLAAGAGLGEACDFGCRLGALAASHPGGTAPVAAEELRALETGRGARRVFDPRFA